MERYRLQVTSAPSTEDFRTILSPFDQTPVADVEQADEATIAQSITNAERAFADRHAMPAHRRISVLEKLATAVTERRDEFARLIALEGGKPLSDALIETDRAAQTIRLAAHEAMNLNGETIPMDLNAKGEFHTAFTVREPIGPVLCISAFNHPLNLICHQAITAFAAGNPVIVKPASQTPVSCIRLVSLLYECGLPEHWMSVVPAPGAGIEPLVSSEKIRFLSFIGSERVGWQLRQTVAAGTRLALEHGGTGTAILLPDADVEAALPGLVKASFYHAGQVCISTQNIYVHESLYEDFILQFKRATQELVTGNPLDLETDVGPVINHTELSRIQESIDAALAGGAQCILGNERIGESCLVPTLLVETSPTMEVMAEEIFGPVVSIVSFSDIQEVVTTLNSSRFSFQASCYTPSIDAALRLGRQIETKAFLVNECTAFRVDWMPFAGAKASGLGTGGPRYAMREMTTEKLLIIKQQHA